MWSRHGDKDNLRILHALLDAAGETQPVRRNIAVDYFFKPRFIDWHFAGLELLYFLRVVIDANDIMSDIGETGARHQADITGTDDCKIHD